MILNSDLATYVPDRATFEKVVDILSKPEIQTQLITTGNYIDLREVIRAWEETAVEIDPTDSTPVLSDEPEDPEVQIETLQARILVLEAELEEHKRSVDAVLEALRPLGTTAEVPVDSETVPFVPAPGVVDYGTAQANARAYLRQN